MYKLYEMHKIAHDYAQKIHCPNLSNGRFWLIVALIRIMYMGRVKMRKKQNLELQKQLDEISGVEPAPSLKKHR